MGTERRTQRLVTQRFTDQAGPGARQPVQLISRTPAWGRLAATIRAAHAGWVRAGARRPIQRVPTGADQLPSNGRPARSHRLHGSAPVARPAMKCGRLQGYLEPGYVARPQPERSRLTTPRWLPEAKAAEPDRRSDSRRPPCTSVSRSASSARRDRVFVSHSTTDLSHRARRRDFCQPFRARRRDGDAG